MDSDKPTMNGDGYRAQVKIVKEHRSVIVDAHMFGQVDLKGPRADDAVVEAQFEVEQVLHPMQLLQ